MDWTNELFVRLYVRDTADWKVLPWQARCLFPLLLRRVDRAGVLETRHGVKGIAALVDMPLEVVETAVAALVEDGAITQHDRGYLVPNFIEAQECLKSDKARAKEYRDRRRALAVTAREPGVTAGDANVTPHHATSRGVTLRREEKRRGEGRIKDPPPSGLRLAEALRVHLLAEKPDHSLADEGTWRRRRASWARGMEPTAAKRTVEAALELMAWVFGDQGGRTEYRFRIDSPRALSEKWDRIETAMRAPAQRVNGRGHGDQGLSAREIWDWAESVEKGEQ